MAAAGAQQEGGALVGQAHDLADLLRQAGALLVAAGGLPVRQRVVRQRAQPCTHLAGQTRAGIHAWQVRDASALQKSTPLPLAS